MRQVTSPIFAYGIIVRHMLFVDMYVCALWAGLCAVVSVPASTNHDFGLRLNFQIFEFQWAMATMRHIPSDGFPDLRRCTSYQIDAR